MGSYSLLLLLTLPICLGLINAAAGDSTTEWYMGLANAADKFESTPGRPSKQRDAREGKVKIVNLVYEPCGKRRPIEINDLRIRYDKDNNILLSYSITTDVDLKSPIKLSVKMCRNLKVNRQWPVTCVPLGCAKELFGTCDFPDICDLFNCTVKKGRHRETGLKIVNPKLPIDWLMFGTYLFTFNLEDQAGKTLACYDGRFSLEEP